MISLVPLAVLTGWVQHTAEQREVKAVEDKHLIIAGSLSRAFQRYVKDVKSVFEHASLMLAAGSRPTMILPLLESMEISSLCMSANSHGLMNILDTASNCSFELESFQLAAIKSHVAQISAPVYLSNLSLINNRPVFLLAKRVDQDSVAIGILETSYVSRSQKSIQFGEKGHSMVVDASGRVVAHPNTEWERVAKDASAISLVQEMIAGKTGVNQFYSPALKADMIAGYTSVKGVGWGVMVPQPYSELIVQAGDVRWPALLVAVVGFAIAALLGWIVSRVLAKPVELISETAAEIANGNSKARVPNNFRSATLEVQELAVSFNRMIDRIVASHTELQQHRDNLEQVVSQRTLELRQQIQFRQQVEVVLQQQKDHLDITLASIGEGVIVSDIDGKIMFLNPVAENLTGWSMASADGKTLNEVLNIIDSFDGHPISLEPDSVNSNPTIDGVLIRRDQSTVEIQKNIARIKDDQEKTSGLVIIVRDVTETRKLSRQLSYEASHDALTGIMNRRAFENLVESVIPLSKDDQIIYCLAYIDLDQFKIVNDACGHAAGDELLCALTQVIQQCIGDKQQLARLGGDEFGILFHHCPISKALEISEQIRQRVEEFRFVHSEQLFHVGVSIGVVEITAESGGLVDIFKAADSACYIAKGNGRNIVHAYHPADEVTVERSGEMQWVSRLKAAFEENRFELHFQPIKSFDNCHSDINHYEILLRLRDEQSRLIFPGTFLPAAARYDLLPTIDRWVFTQSIRWLGENKASLRGGRISINLSGVTLSESSFLEFTEQQFQLHGMSAESMIIEITENSALNNLTAAQNFMTRLKELGCQFALDDFGKGFSSFSSLKHLPVDYVKIDGGFVRDMLIDRMDEKIVRTINEISQSMGKKVIVEYVESEAIWDRLAHFGVDYGQGFAVARPAPLDQFDFLNNDNRLIPVVDIKKSSG